MPTRTAKKATAKPDKTTEAEQEQAVEQQPDSTPEPADAAAAAQARIDELEARLAARESEVAAELAAIAEDAGKPTNVIEAIVAVMREVTHVGKDGVNEHQRFKFRGVDHVVNALGPKTRKHGLVILPRVISQDRNVIPSRNGGSMTSVVVEVEYHFYGPGGVADTISTSVVAEAFDSGDKATAKAMSVAERTALIQAFMLPTDEPDPDSETYERAALPTAEDVTGAVARATQDAQAQGAPVSQAVIAVGNHFGRDILAQVRVTTPDRKVVSGADYIDGIVGYWQSEEARLAAQRAQQQSGAGESGAQGAAPTGADGAQQGGAPGAEQQSAPAESEQHRAESEQHRAATEQARDDVTATQGARNAFAALLINEIAGHATVLGVNPRDYVAPLLAQHEGAQKVADVPVGKVRQWVVSKRPEVAAALRANGHAQVADALERAEGEPIRWSLTQPPVNAGANA